MGSLWMDELLINVITGSRYILLAFEYVNYQFYQL